MNRIFLVCLAIVMLVGIASAETPTSITLSPNGAVLQVGSSLQYTTTCTYAVAATDDCTTAGGVTWELSTAAAGTVTSTGLVTVTKDVGSATGADTRWSNGIYGFYVVAVAGGISDHAGIYIQHVGDNFVRYTTPEENSTATSPKNVVVGTKVTLGIGINANVTTLANNEGIPFQQECNWSSSNPAVATISRYGIVTAVSPGTVTLTCDTAGNGVYGSSTLTGWEAPGNFYTLTVVNGGTSNQTWYVRPDGGSYYDATNSPSGLCDGLSNLAASGATSHHCAVDNLRDLWADGVNAYSEQWVIHGGDTVIVAPTAPGVGYNMNLDAGNPTASTAPGTSGWLPINCNGDPDCTMPSIPSGTSARHTRILGANYANCHADSAKTQLNGSYGGFAALRISDSQYVDIACFEITDKSACADNGNYVHGCHDSGYNMGRNGIHQGALSSYDTVTDVFIHGLGDDGVLGASGIGLVYDHLHIRATSNAGFNMDDSPWGSGNISVAGGLTMNNSLVEWAGGVEEYPVVHNIPIVESRGQTLGAYGDGFGTGATVGDWYFDHDVWRYNLSDNLDLLHSGSQSITVTNNLSYAPDSQDYKMGNADTVIFRNNISLGDCQRIFTVIGDEPATGPPNSTNYPPGETPCRASGDQNYVAMSDYGTYIFQGNTYAGYGATGLDQGCGVGWDECSHAHSTFEDNIALGISYTQYNIGNITPGFFYIETSKDHMPPNAGWATRDHNIYFGWKNGPCIDGTKTATEICADPQFVNEPANTISNDSLLDNYNFNLTSGSQAKFTGIYISATSPDQNGTPRANPASMGALEYITNIIRHLFSGSSAISGSGSIN